MTRLFFPFFAILNLNFLVAQDLPWPDSLVVVKNHVKTVRVIAPNVQGRSIEIKRRDYDTLGRVIRESGPTVHCCLWTYTYDDKNRKTSESRREMNSGRMIYATHIEYLDSLSTRKLVHYAWYDSLRPADITWISYNNRSERKETYLHGVYTGYSITTYDAEGHQTYKHDSTIAFRLHPTAIKWKFDTVRIRTVRTWNNYWINEFQQYEGDSLILHVQYLYGSRGTSEIIDSGPGHEKRHYELIYTKDEMYPTGVKLNGTEQDYDQFRQFQIEYRIEVVRPKPSPETDATKEAWITPSPENPSDFSIDYTPTYDEKGKIVHFLFTYHRKGYIDGYQEYLYDYNYH